jgi:hypothetical protein
MKLGCIVYIPLPAMLRTGFHRKNVQRKPDVDISFDEILMLFMN